MYGRLVSASHGSAGRMSRRVLVLSAAIGEGHDLPARVLATELAEQMAPVDAWIVDTFAVLGRPLSAIAEAGSTFESEWGNRLFDLEYRLLSEIAPTRQLAGRLMLALGGRRLLSHIAAARADVVVSTYPGTTEMLGRLRAAGRLAVPVVSAITDLAALRWWAHPGVDLHLVTHPESIDEVRRIAGATDVVAVRGLNAADFLVPRDRLEARRSLGLPEGAPIVLVSGGGWAVGDLAGAVDVVLRRPGAIAVVLCGRRDDLRDAFRARFGAGGRVRALGFTDRMSDLMAAADALVHSTAGLTVLEAHVRGCPAISYGWGRGHIRANNRAFTRWGIAEVAADATELAGSLDRALARRGVPDLSFAALPSAAEVILDRLDRRWSMDGLLDASDAR
jgi:UDP-N-acetylglucosamine:LPS N-acetylglucosamine transferase